MNPNASKNRKLIKQYPFLVAIISANLEPEGHPLANMMDDLTIRVEKADGNLMYRCADNLGLGDSSFGFQLEGPREGQVMRRGEYAFAVNKNNRVINRLDFPRNDQERREILEEVYAWQVLWSSKEVSASGTSYIHSGCLFNETAYIVWVTVEAWHIDTRNDDAPGSRLGEFRDRLMRVTIYEAPDEGFSQLQLESSVYANLSLDNRLMMRGAVDKNHDLVTINGMLYEMCIAFQDEVYFNGMKERLDNGGVRGASGQFGSVKVLTGELCGYDRVMLEDAVSYVTFQLRPDSQQMYVLGQQGTLPQIRNLVRTVVRMWRERPDLRDAFKPDRNITVL